MSAVRWGVAGIEIDCDESGEEDVCQADGGEDVDLLKLGKVPNAVDERDGQSQAHRNVGPEMVEALALFAAFTQDENGSEDVDDEVGQRAVLQRAIPYCCFFGHWERNCEEITKGPAESGPLSEKCVEIVTRSKWYFRWNEVRRKPASCGRRGTARLS